MLNMRGPFRILCNVILITWIARTLMVVFAMQVRDTLHVACGITAFVGPTETDSAFLIPSCDCEIVVNGEVRDTCVESCPGAAHHFGRIWDGGVRTQTSGTFLSAPLSCVT